MEEISLDLTMLCDGPELNMTADAFDSMELAHSHRPARHRLVITYPIDPRGQKVGGIENHIRLMLQYAPPDWTVLLVGVDGVGDCHLGKIVPMQFRGRTIDFLPVLFFPEEHIHRAAKQLSQSITLQFVLGMLRYFREIKRAIGPTPASFELQRFEFALIPFLMNYPSVQMIHGDVFRDQKMDSLIKKYWFLHRLNEEIALRLARRIVCVNPNILARLKTMNPKFAARAVFMPVPVDIELFSRRDFDTSDNILRIIFAGRLDQFKDPATKFRVLARVHELLGGACEFHYVGTSDPGRYAEFTRIEGFTIRHGYQPSSQVAHLIGRCHMGLLTSFFEGMPCYLLELLAVGRPAAAIRLPQYDLVIEEGVSGTMVSRNPDNEELVEDLALKIVKMWTAIKAGKISTYTVRAKAESYSVGRLFTDHFARHELINAYVS